MNSRKVKKGIIGISSTESGPYRDSMRVHCQSEPARMTATCKNLLGQRIISAKVLRMKELQNQLSDAHYHLNELANENRLLRALQKRQDSALKRYEGTNAELPRIINSHQEELKVLQTKYKQLKFQHKRTCDLLKEKESEIHSLQNQNKHLLKLSKDQHLGEREKLQIQVSDLNHEIQEQHKTIQMLNRKLTLENKRFKHQIHTEVMKHRETRKQLHISLEKLKKLEELLNNREKRLYSNPNNQQLPTFNRKESTSQSLTNLRNHSISTSLLKSSTNGQKSHLDTRTETLPKLITRELDDIDKLSLIRTSNVPDIVNTSETMTSFDNVRKFRLQKSARSLHTSPYTSDENETRDQMGVETNSFIDNYKANQFYKPIDTENLSEHEVANGELRVVMNFEQTNPKNTDKNYRLPEKIIREFGYSSSNSDSSDNDNYTNDDITSPTCNSKYLHSRLINATVNEIDGDSERMNPIASEKSKKLIEYRLDGMHEPNSSNNNRRRRDNNNGDRIVANLHPDISSVELLNPDMDEISLSPSRTGRPDNNDIENDRVISRHNSISSSSHKFDSSNNDEQTNGKDLWSHLREQLDRVHKNGSDHLQSNLNALDVSAIKTNSSTNGELERKADDTSEELLHYFDIEKDANEFSKLSINEDYSQQSQMPIINGLNSECKHDDTMNDENLLNLSENILKDNDDKGDSIENPIEIENNDNSMQKSKDRRSSTRQNDVAKIRGIQSGQQLNKNAQSEADTKTSNLIKQKLLAAMKAIDDNENVGFTTEKKIRETNNSLRSQVTENLYRGLPTHTKKRDDIIKDIFSDTKIDSKLHSGCSKLH